jgi:signal transduction histidine kinase
MSMGAAERMIDDDPAEAKAILSEARLSSASALNELRALVRGINPPVLAERGLVDALRALALDVRIKTDVRAALPSRPESPVEAAVYFAAAELLTNVVKHAHATRTTIDLGYAPAERRLTMSVLDDGVGGAEPTEGSGLAGIERRMEAFGGTMEIDSPRGGPTLVTVVVPCALS